MQIIKIEPCENGAHENRSTPWSAEVPDGWALVPENLSLPDSYPFVTLTVSDVEGVATVTAMEAAECPAFDPPEEPPTMEEQLAALQTALDDADAMNVDQEYRLTLLELGIEE